MSKRKKLIPKSIMWKNTESRTRLLRPVSHDNGSGLAGNNESLWGSGCGDGEVLEDMSEGNENGSGVGGGIACGKGLSNGAGDPEICGKIILPENESTR